MGNGTWQVGEKVIAQFSEDQVWYTGKIDAVKGSGTYTITYTEYGNTEDRTEEFIRAWVDWKVGDKCEAQFTEDLVWYPAEITGPSADGTGFHVRYTEYGNEEDTKVEFLRPLPGAATPAKAAATPAKAAGLDWSAEAPAPKADDGGWGSSAATDSSSGWASSAPAASSGGFGSSGFGSSAASVRGGTGAGRCVRQGGSPGVGPVVRMRRSGGPRRCPCG